MSGEYVQIGKLKKTFGNKGDISFRLFKENDVILQVGDAIFLYLDGIYVPFFLSANNKENKSVLHLDDVDSMEEAEELSGNAIFFRESDLSDIEIPKEELVFGHLKGFLIIDQENREIGIIEDIVNYPMQEMAIIQNNVLIPLNSRLIIDVEENKKTLRYQIIDGLLD